MHVRAPEYFVNSRFQKEGLSKTERGKKTNPSVRHGGGVRRGPGPIFAAVSEMKLVEQVRAYGCKQIAVYGLNFGRAFDAVGGITIGRHVKRLVCIF